MAVGVANFGRGKSPRCICPGAAGDSDRSDGGVAVGVSRGTVQE
jgi:hypothetical protein